MGIFNNENDFYLGANYWSSRDSINMWENWDATVVEEDFKKLSNYGIKNLRMFLTWPVFQPLKAMWANKQLYEYRMIPGEIPLPDTEAGQAGVSEEACEHFEEFCHLADKYNIKLIVGLLTGHMSFRYYAPQAFEWKNFLTDPTVIKWEIRFVRYFVKRFKNENAIIAWDLGNECSAYDPEIDTDQAYIWTHAISCAIRESDSTRPIVSGFAHSETSPKRPFNMKETGELLDVLTTHPYHIWSAEKDPINTLRPCIYPTISNLIHSGLSNKPSFIEEIGSIGYVNCSERTEALFAQTNLFASWSHNCNGFFWWCAFDQGHLEYAPYDWNNFGSDYGLFRADGTVKPIAETTKKFNDFLENFPYTELPKHMTEAVSIEARGGGESNITFILSKQAGFDVSFAYAEDKLADSDLYLMPSVVGIQPMFLHRLNELLEKVRNGATLYLSTSQLFRRFPELTGLTIASREKVDSQTVILGDESFVIHDVWKLNIEAIADTCTVLAYTDDGQPFFVCNKYGKGKIYFMPYELERNLREKTLPFAEDKPAYYKFYEYLFDNSKRVVRSMNTQILTTEHIVDEQKHIVVAINYDSSDAELDITLADGWHISNILYGDKMISGNDACVFEVEKE